MTITFCGHHDEMVRNELRMKLKNILENLITNRNVTLFLCGAYGSFDSLCASLLFELKSKFPNIKVAAVTPYITESYGERNKFLKEHYDEVIYPPIENTPHKFAISKRNEWMIENSDLLISYVHHSWGGAAKTLAYAKRKKKEIICL